MPDVIIVGGGAAGLTAGIYCTHSGFDVLLIEAGALGGQIATAGTIENYPGILTNGAELSGQIATQAAQAGVKILYGAATHIDLQNKLVTVNGEQLHSSCIILATGASPRKLGLPLETELIGRGVSYCATCDGRLFKNRTVAVVGGGNSAVSEALELAVICKEVHLIFRKPSLRAEAHLREQINKVGIILHPSSQVAQLHAADRLQAVTVQTDDKTKYLPVDGLFIAIGREPQSRVIQGQLATDEYGYVLAGEDTKTPIAGVFVAGDVRKKALRQIVTAASDGAVAAYQAISYLNEIS